MNKFLTPLAALAIALTAACTSDDVNGRTEPAPAGEADSGYVSLSLHTPAAPRAGRAANDVFLDGLPSEYRVNDATLILFRGDNEAEANFHSAYNIPLSITGYTDDASQVTAVARITRRITDDAADNKGTHFYALVLLNTAHLVSLSADNTKCEIAGRQLGTLHTGGKPATISDLSNFIVNRTTDPFVPQEVAIDPDYNANIRSTENGILMVSAPLATLPGGANAPTADATVSVLTDITPSIYDTKAKAENSPAADIYVERAVAKVTMDQAITKKVLQGSDIQVVGVDGEEYASLPIALTGWRLDLTNNRSFLVRQCSDEWNALRTASATPTKPYRFVGDEPVAQGVARYRTYWAVDPNYSSDAADHSTQLRQLSGTFPAADPDMATSPLAPGFGELHPQYCMENTFDVANQTQDQTTRAIARVQVGDGQTDYFVVNGNKNRLYTKAAIRKRIIRAIMDDDLVQLAWNESVKDAAGNTLAYTYENFEPRIDLTVGAGSDYATTGKVMVKEYIVYSKPLAEADPTQDDIVTDYFGNYTAAGKSEYALAESLGFTSIHEYENGVCYYPIRIKHFGDDLTPWRTNEGELPMPGNIYPANSAANYLGRYGVLRNNWYNIHVNSILGIGDPVVPDTPDTPDDELYNYISVRINVLSWTLRDQGADL